MSDDSEIEELLWEVSVNDHADEEDSSSIEVDDHSDDDDGPLVDVVVIIVTVVVVHSNDELLDCASASEELVELGSDIRSVLLLLGRLKNVVDVVESKPAQVDCDKVEVEVAVSVVLDGELVSALGLVELVSTTDPPLRPADESDSEELVVLDAMDSNDEVELLKITDVVKRSVTVVGLNFDVDDELCAKESEELVELRTLEIVLKLLLDDA